MISNVSNDFLQGLHVCHHVHLEFKHLLLDILEGPSAGSPCEIPPMREVGMRWQQQEGKKVNHCSDAKEILPDGGCLVCA